jgi:hypothetical protein
MKRIFTLITLAFICNVLVAQEKVDVTQLFDDICQNKITLNELKVKYKNNIQIDESGKDEQLGCSTSIISLLLDMKVKALL